MRADDRPQDRLALYLRLALELVRGSPRDNPATEARTVYEDQQNRHRNDYPLNHRHLGSMGDPDSHFSYSGVHPSRTFGDFSRGRDPLSALSLSLVHYLLR